MNPYHVLGVPPHADSAALQAAYRKLARLHHPDLAPDETARQSASERMVKINWAWHIVSNASRRADFDAQLRAQQIEAARRQQDAFRAQMQGQVVRAQHAHLNDILKAQALRRQQQNQRIAQQSARSEEQVQTQEVESSSASREQQFSQWQATERARQNREARIEPPAPRRAPPRPSREEKRRQSLARARLKRMRNEDKKRSAAPSARCQLADAARLFGQEGRAGEAIAMCHDVLRTDGRNVPARELLGDFYLRLGREDRALPLWEQALALQPDNSSVRRKLNALRPHDPGHYQPRRARAAILEERAARSSASGASFWGRVRDAFRGGS